jgi:hypothetical protein
MIGSVYFSRHRQVLSLRAPARHGAPRLPTQPTAPTLLQMTLPMVLKAALPTAILRSHNEGCAGRPAIISPGSDRRW